MCGDGRFSQRWSQMIIFNNQLFNISATTGLGHLDYMGHLGHFSLNQVGLSDPDILKIN